MHATKAVAGSNMAGVKRKYHGTLPHNITHFLEHDFIGVGDILNGDDMYEERTWPTIDIVVLCGKKKLIGINILNIPEIAGMLKSYIIRVWYQRRITTCPLLQMIALQ